MGDSPESVRMNRKLSLEGSTAPARPTGEATGGWETPPATPYHAGKPTPEGTMRPKLACKAIIIFLFQTILVQKSAAFRFKHKREPTHC